MSTTTFEGEVSRRLREDAMEITRSLEEFMNNRVEVLGQQQDAMGRFDMEMAQIAGEFEEKDEDGAPKVDHNVMRHLNITKKAAESEDYHEFDVSFVNLKRKGGAPLQFIFSIFFSVDAS